ncbi:HIT family protein [Candidatus Pacearchaeota archaeon]|nr:HIT family protein [Candidatus Pacearchaeota archaeon]
MECPFCKINSEKNRIAKDKEFIRVIFSNPRLTPGHLLVVSKRHVEKTSELNEEEQKELFETLIEFQEKILSKVSSGCDVRQNYRPFIPQGRLKVNHLHFHLIPRNFKDEIYEQYGKFQDKVFEDLSSEELDKMLKIFSD